MPKTNPYPTEDPRHWEWILKNEGLGENAGTSKKVALVDAEDARALGAGAEARADFFADGQEAAKRFGSN